ncbi:MAG: tRNA (guanosine(46)-N7)-methyltransferase TrmB [Acidobacteria bacterium]|nr:tRNA (guanosine(46)-N7)-methyltransferase TrmB [Acidobacteriota bacterium]
MPRVRVHHHVNPLAPFYCQAPKAIELAEAFANPSHPLHLDIGCARGRFILRMAEVQPDWNYLGVEIREPLVDEANRLAAKAGLTNLHYSFCNAMLWLDRLLEKIPAGRLQMVTIQFPDPWFKKKHAKRRMVNEKLVGTIARHLRPNGQTFMQTDIKQLADEMLELFSQSRHFEEFVIDANPFPLKTEREKAVDDKGLPVFRHCFVRNVR